KHDARFQAGKLRRHLPRKSRGDARKESQRQKDFGYSEQGRTGPGYRSDERAAGQPGRGASQRKTKDKIQKIGNRKRKTSPEEITCRQKEISRVIWIDHVSN